MLVSYKLLKEYIDLEGLSIKEIEDKLSLAGFELDGVSMLSCGTNLVIGEVLECVAHPNSDHLHVTKTNIGNEVTQIVCGAPNCRAGLKVIVALPGANLPAKGVTIEKGEIRGEVSNGMLCSLLELGVSEDNLPTGSASADGIEELPLDAPVGYNDPLGYLGLDDTILDISITPNRADCFGLYHFIKEVSAILDRPIIKKLDVDVDRKEKSKFTAGSDTVNCDYFSISEIKDITIKPAPTWMQQVLLKHGIKSINNVVDIGNYVTLMTGQPLHMYDADKLESTNFVVKDNLDVEVLALDGKNYQINKGDLVVTNNGKPVCIAGVIGDASTMIGDTTKNIALEAALFNGTTIMNSCKKYGILTVAATNYSKNAVDRYKVLDASSMAAKLLVEYADAKSVSIASEYDARNLKERKVNVSLSFISNRIGVNYTVDQVKDVLRRLDFSYKVNGETFEIDVPSYRNDIEIKDDISEEVVRLIGYDEVPYTLTKVAANKYGLSDIQKARKIINNYLLDNGLTNTLSYTLMKKQDVEYYGIFDSDTPICLPHPLTVEKEYLRKNLIGSMLQTISYNQSRGTKNVAIYELSSCYTNENNNGVEKLAIAISNPLNETKWLGSKKNDFYFIKGIVEGLLALFGIEPNRYMFEPLVNYYGKQTIFHPGKSATLKVNGKVIGMLGEIHPTTLEREGIEPTTYFELDLTEFLNVKTSKAKYQAVSKFPSVSRDIAIVVKDDITINEIVKSMKKAGGSLLNNVEVFDVYKGEHVNEGYKSVALSMTFVDPTKTLVDATINEAFNKIYEQLQKDYNAVIRN